MSLLLCILLGHIISGISVVLICNAFLQSDTKFNQAIIGALLGYLLLIVFLIISYALFMTHFNVPVDYSKRKRNKS
jgi:uncharacterized membrane protein